MDTLIYEEMKVMNISYIFHFLLYIFMSVMHLLSYLKIFWTNAISKYIFISISFIDFILLLYPAIPLFLTYRILSNKNLTSLFKNLSLTFLFISFSLGISNSISLWINVNKSSILYRECPYNYNQNNLQNFLNKINEENENLQRKPSSKAMYSQSNNKNSEEQPTQKKISKSMNKNVEEPTHKRSLVKKNNYQPLKDDEQTNPSLENKRTLKMSKHESSLRNSLKDSLKRTGTFGKKSLNSNSINNVIIPLLNRTKENNCFLNVIIQVLFNLVEFKKELLEDNEDLPKLSQTVTE